MFAAAIVCLAVVVLSGLMLTVGVCGSLAAAVYAAHERRQLAAYASWRASMLR